MQVFFKTRTAARKATFGKLVDNGTNAQSNRRWAREIAHNAKTNKSK